MNRVEIEQQIKRLFREAEGLCTSARIKRQTEILAVAIAHNATKRG